MSTCRRLIALCWCIAIVFTIPYGLYVRLNDDPGEDVNYCEENWESERSRKIFGTITFGLQFIVPFTVISFCYLRVSSRLNSRARTKVGSKTAKKEEADRERKKRTNRMLIAMVGVFGISWLPLSVVNIVTDYVDFDNDLFMMPFFMAHCLAMSSTCYNPFLYAWLNENFRKEFKQVLPCIWRSGYNDRAYRNGYRSDQLMQSQADGVTVTRASEIIPRGPTCGNSMKKVVMARDTTTAGETGGGGSTAEATTTTTTTMQQVVTSQPSSPTVLARSRTENGGVVLPPLPTMTMTITTEQLANDVLETRFDGGGGPPSAMVVVAVNGK